MCTEPGSNMCLGDMQVKVYTHPSWVHQMSDLGIMINTNNTDVAAASYGGNIVMPICS